MIRRCYLGEIPVDAGLRSEVGRTVGSWLLSGQESRQVVTLNAAMLSLALGNTRLKGIIQKADLVIVDGYGIKMALERRGIGTQSFPGVELAVEMISLCIREKLPVYCFGGTKRTVTGLRQKYDGSAVFCRDGFSEDEALIREEIVKLDPRLLLVGLGSPRQECFLAEILPDLTATVGIGIGGALEIISGQKPRAPQFLINHGGEWCYRMFRDPKKLKLLPELIKFWYRFLR